MSKIKTVLFILYSALLIISSISFYIWLAGDPIPIIREVEVVKNVDRIVYRDYKTPDCCGILQKYDTSPMLITYKINEMKSGYTGVDLTWRLYERTGEQEIKVPVGQSGNWKLYTGLGIGAVAVGGLVCLIK